MELNEVMAELEGLGREQTVKTYRRHCADGEIFGVSFGDLGKLKKKIKVDHALAILLWETGNVDARTLATMVGDKELVTVKLVEGWLRGTTYPLLWGQVAGLVLGSGKADRLLLKWTEMKKENFRTAGYTLLCGMLKVGAIGDDLGRVYLEKIEREIHGSANHAKNAMNMALIGLGIYLPRIRKDVIVSAERIGVVVIDHGDTGCKTPDAVSYIKKAVAREKGKRGG